ncbi:MAG TPA: hypothetical protein VE988_19900 [Gemmataceae bacterium]|nr:hypothetical protein [Gemmataceae bacterium]
MAIEIQCDCGKSLQVKEELAGRKVRCPACAKVLAVPDCTEIGTAENEVFNLLSDSTDVPNGVRPSAQEPHQQALLPESLSPSVANAVKPLKRVKHRKPVIDDRDWKWHAPLLYGKREIIVGIFLILAALVFFAIQYGSTSWRFRVYPIVLLVMGLAALYRGITGRE